MGGGVYRDPKFVLRNKWTAHYNVQPQIHCKLVNRPRTTVSSCEKELIGNKSRAAHRAQAPFHPQPGHPGVLVHLLESARFWWLDLTSVGLPLIILVPLLAFPQSGENMMMLDFPINIDI